MVECREVARKGGRKRVGEMGGEDEVEIKMIGEKVSFLYLPWSGYDLRCLRSTIYSKELGIHYSALAIWFAGHVIVVSVALDLNIGSTVQHKCQCLKIKVSVS